MSSAPPPPKSSPQCESSVVTREAEASPWARCGRSAKSGLEWERTSVGFAESSVLSWAMSRLAHASSTRSALLVEAGTACRSSNCGVPERGVGGFGWVARSGVRRGDFLMGAIEDPQRVARAGGGLMAAGARLFVDDFEWLQAESDLVDRRRELRRRPHDISFVGTSKG